jgi:hypothetical protein
MSNFKRKRKKKMENESKPEVPPEALEVAKERVIDDTQLKLEISRGADAQSLSIFVQAPLLASVIRNMTPSNYAKDEYDKIYAPILKELAANKTRVITRAAIAKATRNFVAGTDFSWTEPPRAILLANPDALEEGYTLQYKVDTPVAQDQLRKWAKQFMDGCMDIISNARPFKMSWVMNKE